MLNSFAMMHAGFTPARNAPTQFIARGIVPEKDRDVASAAIFGNFS